MKFHGKAEQVATSLVEAFRTPASLPQALSQVFINRDTNAPQKKWSYQNQILMALQHIRDARGFRQWQKVNRQVKKGEKAHYILGPCTKKVEDKNTKEEKIVLLGFKAIPVFDYEQTEGDPLPGADEAARFIERIPFTSVLEEWGITIDTEGFDGNILGYFQPGENHISLSTENLSTACHEMIHAADSKLGTLQGTDKQSREIVAELGGAVLLESMGKHHEADLGGAYEYIKRYADSTGKDVVKACTDLLSRTCACVQAILDTSDSIIA